MLNLPKLCHLKTLEPDDLPHLIERRQAVYKAIDLETDAKQFGRLWDMAMWLTEQIVYLKAAMKKSKS